MSTENNQLEKLATATVAGLSESKFQSAWNQQRAKKRGKFIEYCRAQCAGTGVDWREVFIESRHESRKHRPIKATFIPQISALFTRLLNR